MSELYVAENIVIDDIEFVISKIEDRTGFSNVQVSDIDEFIKNEPATMFYIDDKFNVKMEEDKSSHYLWIDTGFEEDGKPIFISMINNYGYYEGHFTGHYRFLANGMMNYFPGNYKAINDNIYKFETKYRQKIEKRLVKHLNEKYQSDDNFENRKFFIEPDEEPQNSKDTTNETFNGSTYSELSDYTGYSQTSMANQIRKQLLVDNWKSIEGLERYIKIIGARLWQIIEQGKTECYILNRAKSAIINTGMLDKFGEDIRIMYRVNLTRKTYDAYKLIESKTDFLENDFTKEQTLEKIKPISFFDDEETFSATIQEFDINTKSLTHIINERRERFSEELQELSDDVLAARIKNALELGLKLAERDKTFVKPNFSGKYRGIAWLMPLHLNSSFTDDPELVLVVNKMGEFYEIKTILPYDDGVKDRITAMTLYSKLW